MANTVSPSDGLNPEDAKSDAPRSVAHVLAKTQARRDDAARAHESQLQEVDAEMAKIKQAIEELQRQLTALDGFRSELATKRTDLEREYAQQAHDEIFALLQSQATDIAARAAEVQADDAARDAEITRQLESSDLGETVREYRQFRENAHQLEALPASYRDALVSHHRGQKQRIREFVAAADPGPTSHKDAPLSLDVIYSVDSVEDEPALISIVMPISESVHTHWHDRSADLQLTLASKVVQAVYQAAHGLGLTKAHAMYGGHRGLLAVELEIGNDHGDTLGPTFESLMDTVLGASRELELAGVVPRIAAVPVDYLLSPSATAEADDVA